MKQRARLVAVAIVFTALACERAARPTAPEGEGGPLTALAPAAPALVGPADGAAVTVPFTISWSPVLDPAALNGGYNWQVSTSPTFAKLVILDAARPSETQDVVSGLPSGTYYWRVNAVSGTLETSAWSATRSFTVTGAGAGTPGTPVLAPPQGYSTFHPREVLRFNWSAVADAVSYRIEVSSDSTFPMGSVPGTLTFWFDNLPTPTSSFEWGNDEGRFFARVFAVSADNPETGIRSLPSNLVPFSVFYDNPIGPPPSPTAPAEGATLTLPLTLEWAHVPNPQPSGYEVQIASDPSFAVNEAELGVQLTEPRFRVLSLTAGTKYWRVRSHQGMSSPTTTAPTAWSETRTFTVSTAPPTPVSIAPTVSPLYSGDDTWVEVQLTAGVPASGATVALASSNPSAAPVPATLAFPGTHAWAQFQMTAGQVTAPTPVTLTATLNGKSASSTFTLNPPSLRSLTTSFPDVSGGTAASAIVALNGRAPAGGAVVSLASSSPAVMPPATVTIPAGSASAPVSIPTRDVSASTPAVVTASWNGATAQLQLTVRPSPAPTSLTLSPATLTGGGPGSGDGIVTIGSAATFDQMLTLTSSNPSVLPFLSSAVMIPAGSTRGSFLVMPSAVPVQTIVTIAVTGGGVTRSADLTVNPADEPVPTAPSLLLPANDATPAQPVAFDWSDVANAAGYEIQIDNTSTIAAPFVASQTTTASAAAVGGLPAQRLWWRVRARNSAGVYGPFSATRRFTPQAASTTPTTPTLSTLALSPTSVTGGGSAQGTVTLSAAAPSGGAVVALSSSSAAAATPASVTVAAGATSASFAITTTAVASSTSATISAAYGGVTRTATLTVSPASTSTTLAAPSLVSPAADQQLSSGRSITFDWSDVSGAASYEIQIDDDGTFPAPLIVGATVTASQYATSTLPARRMWWRVRAVASSGAPGTWSAVRRFEVK